MHIRDHSDALGIFFLCEQIGQALLYQNDRTSDLTRFSAPKLHASQRRVGYVSTSIEIG